MIPAQPPRHKTPEARRMLDGQLFQEQPILFSRTRAPNHDCHTGIRDLALTVGRGVHTKPSPEVRTSVPRSSQGAHSEYAARTSECVLVLTSPG